MVGWSVSWPAGWLDSPLVSGRALQVQLTNYSNNWTIGESVGGSESGSWIIPERDSKMIGWFVGQSISQSLTLPRKLWENLGLPISQKLILSLPRLRNLLNPQARIKILPCFQEAYGKHVCFLYRIIKEISNTSAKRCFPLLHNLNACLQVQ